MTTFQHLYELLQEQPTNDTVQRINALFTNNGIPDRWNVIPEYGVSGYQASLILQLDTQFARAVIGPEDLNNYEQIIERAAKHFNKLVNREGKVRQITNNIVGL